MDDTELLQRYVSTGCQEAFGQLVGRHIDFVYASARRMTRDAHLAEDVTQGVFIVLARKAGHVRCGAVLPAWLHSTARNVSSNILSVQSRRRHHEEKAAAMKPVVRDDSSSFQGDDEALSAALDDALGRLGTSDRGAVVMRYLQGKSIRDVAAAMHVSDDAAQKRVSRAVARMRDYFAHRGLTLDESGMISGLSRQTAQVAPAALASMVTTKSLASAGGSAGWAAHCLSRMASLKVAAACAATVAIVATVATVTIVKSDSAVASSPAAAAPTTAVPAAALPPDIGVTFTAPQVWQPYVPSDTPPIETLAIKNEELASFPSNFPDYTGGIDENVRRGSGAAAFVRSAAIEPKAAGGAIGKLLDAKPYRGKRVRLNAYLKSEDVSQQASMVLWVADADDFATAQDDMGGHWLVGSNDWKKYDIVCDVSPEATTIAVQGYIRGTGALFIDDIHLDVVGKDVPLNDDHRWRSWTFFPSKYATTLDKDEQRNGHPTICVSCPSAERNDWNTYDHTLGDITALRGKRLKFSAMIKSQDVAINAGPLIRIVGKDNSTAKRDEQFAHRPVKGSVGWMHYATFINVPADAKGMSYGITINGAGTIWFDDLKLEIVK